RQLPDRPGRNRPDPGVLAQSRGNLAGLAAAQLHRDRFRVRELAMRALSRQAGMSMVELMVAMAIALIGTIIIFQVFEVSEGIRRTTTSGGDAQQNGQIGLYAMEADLRNAGMGFNDTQYAGCNASAYDSTRSPT